MFDQYDSNKVARDAFLFQISDVKHRKRVLAKDMNVKDIVKTGLAHEQTQVNADQMAGSSGSNEENSLVQRVVQEEVKRLNLSPGRGAGDKIKCQTCTGSHKMGFVCPGKKCKKVI